MKSNKLDELKKEFDLLWGIAPKGTLKHDRGHQIKKLIQKAFEAGELEMLERVEEIPVRPVNKLMAKKGTTAWMTIHDLAYHLDKIKKEIQDENK